jgi:hypothetical protein
VDDYGGLGTIRDDWGRLGTIGDDWGRLGTIGDDWGRLGTIRDDWGRLGTIGDNWVRVRASPNLVGTEPLRFRVQFRISDFGFTHTPSQPLMKTVAMRELLRCLLGSFAVSYICYVHISAFIMRFS